MGAVGAGDVVIRSLVAVALIVIVLGGEFLLGGLREFTDDGSWSDDEGEPT